MTDCLSADQRYETVEKFVHMWVWRFRARYGFPLDELRSEAFMGYVAAVETYDGRSKFITWVGEKVKGALLTYVRKEASRRRGEYADLDAVPHKPCASFDLDAVLARLTPDAKELVRLVFDTPVPVLMELAELGEETPANVRYALRCWLRDCGWAVQRITDTFTEVREAL
jgi:RNA polymerase sigma factor (sigma-70 family)